jgi:hypothetical protein
VNAMKNKLYDFLDKHSAFISVFGIAAWLCWLCFVFNLHANKPVAIAAAVFVIVFICVASFEILEATYRSHARALHPPGEHTEDAFLRVLSELAKLTQQSKAEVLANALNFYYRAVTLPAADLELLRSFLEDLEKKQGIDWSATANPPDPPSV